MLRWLQVAGLIALLALGAMLPIGAYLWKPDSGGAPYPPDRVPTYLKSSETAARWAEARYYGRLAGRQGAPEAQDSGVLTEGWAGD